MREKEQDSLLTQSFDLVVAGIILTSLIYLTQRQITGENIIVICCFLALRFLWKLIWPIDKVSEYFAWQLFAIVMIGLCSWSLIYAAEVTRAGWYRTHVLQERVEDLVHNSPAYVVLSDTHGIITSTSNNIGLLTGYLPEELIGEPATLLIRKQIKPKHMMAYNKAVDVLKSDRGLHSGWMLQGIITTGLRHKDGHIVPVRIYAGGIRWSTNIQFDGDIDIFAVFIPVPEVQAKQEILENVHTTLSKKIHIESAPQAPTVRQLDGKKP